MADMYGVEEEELTNQQKAAVLFIALGPEYSAKLFKHMDDDEIERVTLEIANQKQVSAEQKAAVISEFYQMAMAKDYISTGGLEYAQNVLDNAQALCKGLQARDIDIVSGGTDNHLMLIDLTRTGLTGKQVENLLDEAHITANKNTIPNEQRSPFVTSGIRLGSPAATTRGLGTEDFDRVAEAISIVIKKQEAGIEEARAIIKTITDKYPLV